MLAYADVITIFLTAVLIILSLICKIINKQVKYLNAVTLTLSAWVIGQLLDGATDESMSFRTLLPIIAMGLCIINEIGKNKPQ